MSTDVKEKLIDAAEVRRLIDLAHGLVTRSVRMTEGDLLVERIGIGRALLRPEHTEAVYAQICEAAESRNVAAIRFADAVLVPLIGTQSLAVEQLKNLLSLFHNSRTIDTADAAFSLCYSNAFEMERLVETFWSRVPDVIGVYRATRSPVLLERLIAEASKALTDGQYPSEHCREETQRILSVIVKNPLQKPSLRDGLLGLLRSSKPGGPLREHLEALVAETRDIALLLAFEADLTASRDRLRGSSWLEETIQSIRKRREHLIKLFDSEEATSLRRLFDLFRECEALPYRSDGARLELRSKAVEPARVILEHAPSLLTDFADVFAADDEGQTDLVYVACCLPRRRILIFLRSELKRTDLSPAQHAAFALALSYASQKALPETAHEPLVAPADGRAARTWWGDAAIEKTCHDACGRSASYLGRVFESSPKSHEERLTGMFLVKLQTEMQHWAKAVEIWAAKRFGRHSSVHCSYEDVAAYGPEKVWGADIGFYLRVRANGVLTAERAFLAQAKKASVSAQGKELAWTIPRWTPENRPYVDTSKPANGAEPEQEYLYLARGHSGKHFFRVSARRRLY
jgi:hypothetical protein